MRKEEAILTPTEFKEEMERIVSEFEYDKEAAHAKMDKLMTAVLISMGYEDGIKVYNNLKK
jgi:hypothetical protein